MNALLASLRKEQLLLVRDWHALLVLFAMPSAFVLIMSLALQDNLAGQQSLQLQGYVVSQDGSRLAQRFEDELMQHSALGLEAHEGPLPSLQQHRLGIRILPQFSQAFNRVNGATQGVELQFSPDMSASERLLAQAAVREAFAHFNTTLLAGELGFDRQYAEQEMLKIGFIQAADSAAAPLRPNAVQQNVPAWLIFAMFFIAIPISTTFIQERRQKTLTRLRTMNASVTTIFSAKLLPYLVINLVQLVLMLAIGAYVIPLLGGYALSLDVSWPGLALVSVAVSMAALGFASLVATVARSIEQATVISGTFNIIFAAVGGIMIPTFIMPPIMQTLSKLSPMAWGLEGYLDILLRNGTAVSVLPTCAGLAGFGLGLFLLAILVLRLETHHG